MNYLCRPRCSYIHSDDLQARISHVTGYNLWLLFPALSNLEGKFQAWTSCFFNFLLIYFYFREEQSERKGKRNTDLLFHLFTHSLVSSCIGPDWALDPQCWDSALTKWAACPGQASCFLLNSQVLWRLEVGPSDSWSVMVVNWNHMLG